MLTRKQYELLLYIDAYLRRTGCSPSFDEMKEALGLRSKSGVHRLVSGLEERGFLSRRHNRARALEVLRVPQAEGGAPRPETEGSVVPMPVRSPPAALVRGGPDPVPEGIAIPLYGRIAAGQPIEALADETEEITVPASMLGGGEHYALTVSGDSMIEAGILDGDVAIIRRCETAENDQIVVALIDGGEATLKKFHRRGSTVALEPANRHYETRLLPASRVHVQGRLVGLFRRY